MRRKLILFLVVLNCLLGLALLARAADSQILPLGIKDCCKGVGGDAYCCWNCCWFISDCQFDRDCSETMGQFGG